MKKIKIDTSLTAREIMVKYDLPKATAYRAKKRGHYFHSKQVEPATRRQQARFMEICDLKPLTVGNLQSVPVQKYYDIQKGKSTLSVDEWLGFQAEMLALRGKLRNFVIKPNIHTFRISIFSNPLVKHHLLIPDRSLVERFRSGVKVPPEEFRPYGVTNVKLFIRDLKT